MPARKPRASVWRMQSRLIGPTGAATASPSASPARRARDRGTLSTLPSSPLGARTTTKNTPRSLGVCPSRQPRATPSLPAPGAGLLLHAGASNDRSGELRISWRKHTRIASPADVPGQNCATRSQLVAYRCAADGLALRRRTALSDMSTTARPAQADTDPKGGTPWQPKSVASWRARSASRPRSSRSCWKIQARARCWSGCWRAASATPTCTSSLAASAPCRS